MQDEICLHNVKAFREAVHFTVIKLIKNVT